MCPLLRGFCFFEFPLFWLFFTKHGFWGQKLSAIAGFSAILTAAILGFYCTYLLETFYVDDPWKDISYKLAVHYIYSLPCINNFKVVFEITNCYSLIFPQSLLLRIQDYLIDQNKCEIHKELCETYNRLILDAPPDNPDYSTKGLVFTALQFY